MDEKWEEQRFNLAKRMKYYLENYDLVFSYTETAGRKIIEDLHENICRFCGKSHPEVTFRERAHAISEFAGNKYLFLKNECDDCNQKFGHNLEDDFGKYIGLGRTLSQVHGKKGVPSYKAPDGSWRIDLDQEKGYVVQMMVNDEKYDETDCDEAEPAVDHVRFGSNKYIEMLDNNMLVFHAMRDAYTPIAVYKSLVKMALSVLPYDKLGYFVDTIAWIQEESHLIGKYDFSNLAYVYERFVSGMAPLHFSVKAFLRKKESIIAPFYVFVLTFANYSYQIVVPSMVKDAHLEEYNSVDVYPVPGDDEVAFFAGCEMPEHYASGAGRWLNLSGKEKVHHEKIDFYMGYQKIEEHPEERGKSVDDVLAEEGITVKKRLKKEID